MINLLARCDHEIASMQDQPGEPPAWLVALGINDWEVEKELIAIEQAPLAYLLTQQPEDVTDAELEFAMRLAMPGCNATVTGGAS